MEILDLSAKSKKEVLFHLGFNLNLIGMKFQNQKKDKQLENYNSKIQIKQNLKKQNRLTLKIQ